MNFFLTVASYWGLGLRLHVKGRRLEWLESQKALTLFTSKCNGTPRGDEWGLLDSFLVNKAEGWPLDFFLIKRKQGFLVVSGAAPEVWLFFLEGIFVKVVCRPRSDPGACPGWACKNSFCPYSKARRGGISEPCGPGKVEKSDQSLLYPRHPKKLQTSKVVCKGGKLNFKKTGSGPKVTVKSSLRDWHGASFM